MQEQQQKKKEKEKRLKDNRKVYKTQAINFVFQNKKKQKNAEEARKNARKSWIYTGKQYLFLGLFAFFFSFILTVNVGSDIRKALTETPHF